MDPVGQSLSLPLPLLPDEEEDDDQHDQDTAAGTDHLITYCCPGC
jgi:hypothetical protein